MPSNFHGINAEFLKVKIIDGGVLVVVSLKIGSTFVFGAYFCPGRSVMAERTCIINDSFSLSQICCRHQVSVK